VSGHAAVVDEGKAALAGSATLEDGGGGGLADGGGHGDRSTDECVDGGVISEDAEEGLDATTAGLGSAGLESLKGSEPVSGRSDDLWRRSSWESRWGREEGDEVVGDEAPVGVRDGELSWAGGSTIDDSRDVDVECGEALSTGVEEAVSRQDVDQSERLVSANERILVRQSVSNSSHSGVGIGAFLVLEEGHALSGDGRHFEN